MAEDSQFETDTSRDRVRVFLVACCLLAIVLAGTVVPALSTGGVASSPISSALPGPPSSVPSSSTGNVTTLGGSGGQLGALDPGSQTDVGGDIGADGSAFRSQNAAVHFVVESPQPAYWRTGAYVSYTGEGWLKPERGTTYSGPIDTGGLTGQKVTYEVTLKRPATSVPTVWRPRTVSGLPEAMVTNRRAIRVPGGIQSGTTVTATSVRPPRDTSLLRTSGSDYPARVEGRYTQLPSDTPDRVTRFTDRLTADASGPYETAQTIEQWLERNKSYSLNAGRTSDHIADTFIFEMERGYCEYFATSMVVMLRSQGIPARYVVGYSTGDRAGENTYRVRGMNAHAWVEVYFEDVGWVKFDPTPGSARLQAEQEAMQQQRPGEEYSPTEQGSPGEQFSLANASGTITDLTGGETETKTTADGYSVSLNRSPTPGAVVEVTVTRDELPAAGVQVYFNGDLVGQAGRDGTVVGTVPYASELRISLGTPSNGGDTAASLASGTLADSKATSPGRAAVDGPALADVTYPVETNATVTVTGQRRPGGTVTVTAAVDGVPVRDGTVTLDGDAVAVTDGDGRAQVRLPGESGNVTVGIERGPVSGETTVRVPALSVSVDPTAPVALPGTSARVTVRVGDQPAQNASVLVGGTRVATTGVDGTATVTLPLTTTATVRATTGALSASQTVSGLLVNLFVVLGLLVGAVGGAGVLARRRGYTPRRLLGGLVRLPGLAVRYTEWLLVALATRGDELAAAALARLRTTVGYVIAVLRGQVRIAEARAALRAWLRQHREGDEMPPPPGEGGAASGARLTIRQAWHRLVTRVSASDPETKTPGELAAHAIERDGLPAEDVETLRDTFREVEYGSRAADERLERVQRAMRRIRRERGER